MNDKLMNFFESGTDHRGPLYRIVIWKKFLFLKAVIIFILRKENDNDFNNKRKG